MFILAALATLICAQSRADVTNWAVGEIAGKAITKRQVQINYILEKILFNSGDNSPKPDDSWILTAGSSQLTDEVTSALLERVASLEAHNFDFGKADQSDLNLQIEKVKNVVKNWQYWQSLEVTREELSSAVELKYRAKKFIHFRVRSMIVPVTDTEAQEYYEKNRARFGDMPFEAFKKNIKAFLSQQHMDERLREWFELLKRRYAVRNYEAEKKS